MVGAEGHRGRVVEACGVHRRAVPRRHVDRGDERRRKREPHARTRRSTSAIAATAAATPTTTRTIPDEPENGGRPEQEHVDDERAEHERADRRGAPDDEARLGLDPRILADRPRRELGREEEQRPDDCRAAVDHRVPFPSDQVRGTDEHDRPGNGRREARDEAEREQGERQRRGGAGEVGELAGMHERVRSRGGQGGDRAERGDHTRA